MQTLSHLCVLACVTVCGPDSTANAEPGSCEPSHWRIAAGRVGPLHGDVELNLPNLRGLLSGCRIQEIVAQTLYEVSSGRRLLMKVSAGTGRGIEVDIRDTSIRTRDGLGLGSSLGQVKRQYKDLSCRRVRESEGPAPGDWLYCVTDALPGELMFDRAGLEMRSLTINLHDPAGR
jgi:hypothetical protein